MHIRITTVERATDIDRGIAFLREHAVAALQQQQGYRGLTASADRAAGTVGVLTLWETEDDLNASESASEKVRQEGLQAFGGTPTVERFEQTVVEMGAAPPAPGSKLVIRRFRMQPAQIDENLAFFTSTVLPGMKAMPGFLAVRQMVNRSTGEGLTGSVWADDESLDASIAAGEQRRAEAASRGVELEDATIREVIFQAL